MKTMILSYLILFSFSVLAQSYQGTVTRSNLVIRVNDVFSTVSWTMLELENGQKLNLCANIPLRCQRQICCFSDRFDSLIGRQISIKGHVQPSRSIYPGMSEHNLIVNLRPRRLADQVDILDQQTEIRGLVTRVRNGLFKRSLFYVDNIQLKPGLLTRLRSLGNKECVLSGDLQENVLRVHKARCLKK